MPGFVNAAIAGARPCGIAMAEIASNSRIGGIERPPKKKIVLLRCAPGSSISPKSSSTPLWRTLPSQVFRRNAGHPDDELADFAAVFRNRVRVRAKASAPAPAGRERGGSRLVGGRFSFSGRWRGRLGRPPECRERLPNGKSDYRENTPTHLARWRTRLEFDRRSSR